MKKTFTLILLSLILLLLSVPAPAESSAPARWFCMFCGTENTGASCTLCGKPARVWICASCGADNLTGACRSCGTSREASLKAQAADSSLLRAYPAARTLADEGVAEGIMALGRYYALGLMIPQDTVMALSCYQMAGTMGYAPAWIALAKMYDQGVIVNRDYAKSMEYYQRAADLGDPEGIWSLGTFYEEGFSVRKDPEKMQGGDDIPEGHYADDNMRSTVVPFRNGIMLSIAVGIAESHGLQYVMMANHGGDHTVYPDCRPEFVRAFDEAAAAGTFVQVHLRSPYTHLTKADIACRGKALGINYAETWSCYKGSEHHCGLCGTCVERREALAAAGITDTTVYDF